MKSCHNATDSGWLSARLLCTLYVARVFRRERKSMRGRSYFEVIDRTAVAALTTHRRVIAPRCIQATKSDNPVRSDKLSSRFEAIPRLSMVGAKNLPKWRR